MKQILLVRSVAGQSDMLKRAAAILRRTRKRQCPLQAVNSRDTRFASHQSRPAGVQTSRVVSLSDLKAGNTAPIPIVAHGVAMRRPLDNLPRGYDHEPVWSKPDARPLQRSSTMYAVVGSAITGGVIQLLNVEESAHTGPNPKENLAPNFIAKILVVTRAMCGGVRSQSGGPYYAL